MKLRFLLLCLAFPFIFSIAQTKAALIVGISEYPTDPLRYAHRDAEEFKKYLESRTGDNFKMVKLLTEKDATFSRIGEYLQRLVTMCQANGDEAIIFLAGHGDALKGTNMGFFLAHNTPQSHYMGVSISMDILTNAVNTLAARGVKVTLIMDACRSGQLARNTYSGQGILIDMLQNVFKNQTLILSCGRDELSYEYDDLGGGRGVFSYYLIEGLKGKADKSPEDLEVTVMELELFLRDSVRNRVAGELISQLPSIKCTDDYRRVAFVYPNEDNQNGSGLSQIVTPNSDVNPPLNSIRSDSTSIVNNSSEPEIKVDSLDKKVRPVIYQKFLDALDKRTIPSAIHLFNSIIADKGLDYLHSQVKSELIVAIQEEAQNWINFTISEDSTALFLRYRDDRSISQHPKNLEFAAGLMGKEHLLYNNVKMKQLYLEALNIRLNNDLIGQQHLIYKKAKKRLESALAFVPEIPFIYREKGLIEKKLNNYQRAVTNFEIAKNLAPFWNLAYRELGNLHYQYGAEATAKTVFNEYLKRAPNSPQAYFEYALFEYKRKNYALAEASFQKSMEIDYTYTDSYFGLANVYKDQGKMEMASEIIRKSSQNCDKRDVYSQFANFYFENGQFQKKDLVNDILPEWGQLLDSNRNIEEGFLISYNPKLIEALGDYYIKTDRYDLIESSMKNCISTQPELITPYHVLFDSYEREGKFEKADSIARRIVSISPTKSSRNYYNMALICARQKNINEFLFWFEKFLENMNPEDEKNEFDDLLDIYEVFSKKTTKKEILQRIEKLIKNLH